MKTFFAFALVLFTACTDDASPTDQQEDTTTQGLVCSSTADCISPTAVCVKPNATSTVGMCVPTNMVPSTCNPMGAGPAACPVGTNCNPICSTTGIAGYKCEPAGVPTKYCPTACTPVPNNTQSSCPANHYCAPACGPTATSPNHICVPVSSTPPICM